VRYDSPGTENPTPITQIVDRAFGIYAVSFKPLLTIGAIAAVVGNLPPIVGMGSETGATMWLMLMSAVTTGLMAAAVTGLVITGRAGAPLTMSAARESIRRYGMRFVGGTTLLSLAQMAPLMLPVWASLWAGVIAIYLVIRLSLFGPAIVIEEADIADSMGRSWGLLGGRWWRTLALLLLINSPNFAVVLVTLVLPIPGLVTFVLLTVVGSVVGPFIVVAKLLLFEDYRHLAHDQPGAPADAVPPEGPGPFA
jgi:hypothetical protein